MADITVSYKGATIAEVSASGTTTLGTSGKYCEDDISIAYTKPSGTSYVKIGEADYTLSTSSTSATSQPALSVSSSVWTSAKMIFITVRDKAGKRAGYYYGSDFIFMNPNPSNGSTSEFGDGGRFAYTCDSSSKMHTYSGQYGLYAYSIGSSGSIRMYSRYNSTYTLTIDGTYHVEVYALSWPDSSPLT